MKPVSIRAVPTRSSSGNILVRCAGPLVAAAFIAAGQLSFATSYKEPCNLSVDSYLVLHSNLEYSDVSASYATSIYNSVRTILSGFLASGEDYCFFHDQGETVDLTDHVPNALLSLHCQVKRVSSKVFLTVRLDVYETNENLLSFETSEPFFQPTDALHDFAASFPKAFAGQVVRDYSFPVVPQGFHFADYLPRDIVLAGNIKWNIADLENDLNMTEGVPTNVLESINAYRTRENIEWTVSVLGALTALGTAAAIMVVGGGIDSDNNFANPVPDGLWIACGAGFLTSILALVAEVIFPPNEILMNLNRWHTAEAEK